MPARSRFLLATAAVAVVAGLAVLWLRNQPRTIGQLPREDVKQIRSLLAQDHGSDLLTALRTASSDALADWMLNRRAGRLVALRVQNPDRVEAYVTAATPSQGRLLILDRSTNGWGISGTNDTVTFGRE